MIPYQGPAFQLVDTIAIEQLEDDGFQPRHRPLLVKGAVKRWPAWEKWSFDQIADLQHPDNRGVVTSFQNGLVEQGVTNEPLLQPVGPYLRELGASADTTRAERRDDIGLCPERVWKHLRRGKEFHLDWSYLSSFTPNKVYLAQWDILKEFPALRQDFAIRSLWKGWRWTWEYVFMGPANTVTGLHFDFPNNWFCQVRGVKEFLLFPPENTPHMCRSRKYDWGATLSDINISKLHEQPKESASFARTRGLYARVEPGDALFVPKKTWHCVVALEPSISLAVFGLTLPEIIIGGGASETRALLHKLHLYRWGNCTCHKAKTGNSPG